MARPPATPPHRPSIPLYIEKIMNSHNGDFFHDEPEPEVSSCSPAELAPVELGLDLEFSILEHHLPHKHCTQGFFLNTQAEP
jgi:hypothetical protein